MPTSKRWTEVWLQFRSYYFLILTVLFLSVGGYSAFKNIRFLSGARKGQGTVTALNYTHTTCLSRRKDPYDCTKFIAITRFDMDDSPVDLELDAGETVGHVSALDKARWKVGENVPMVYNYTAKDFRVDSFWDLWKFVVVTLGGGAVLGALALRHFAVQKES